MSRFIRTLAVATAAGGLTLAGLLTAGAASATTGPQPGTTGPGSWKFLTFDPNWNATNGITSSTSPPTVSYTATVQQPINAPGQIPSVFSNKTRTIPVKYTVNKCTTPGGSTAHYPSVLESDSSAFKTGSNPNPTGTISTNLNWTPPTGPVTVSDITNLAADYTWSLGTDHGGSMRWQIDTPAGAIQLYYGDEPNTASENTPQTGVNMVSLTDQRTDTSQLPGGTFYDTWSHARATWGSEPVQDIGLVVDGGFGGDQQVSLQDATIGTDITSTSTYTQGIVSSGGGPQTCATDTTDPMWISLTKISGNAPAAPVDESTITGTQGDTGGQFRVVSGFYMYNLPMTQLDPTAQYQVGISPNSDGSNPAGVVGFGLK
jgi:hypothetical protein